MTLRKLVRDKIPAIVEAATSEIVHTRILDTEEYLFQLKWKLLEEVREANDSDDPQKILEELADLQEVMNAYVIALGFSKKELERKRIKKRAERGGFEGKIFLIGTERRS